ncbi:hypothetical protein TRFO_18954 [Tritrichomonas foetus]|uniref:Cyclin N-terminal domain-containing protein n=1 Tax=Tritrichomonas foetus TaxID=1144522 RepID=A0A1J4KJL4_9EUKA|nr:hypothetical protein TRFO_18954 [Tritrichomonas foetus]|eukprot:OHT11513.1 hypothetical protein TRFO_18954 [Tritrichomonas foetus]
MEESDQDSDGLTLPLQIIKETIHLHKIFYQLLGIKSPLAIATGMYFYNKFYQKKEVAPPRYALYAISCLHLATKICEVPVSMTKFIRILESNKNEIRKALSLVFQTLDGIPPQNTPNFNNIVNKLLVDKEMEVIKTLDFNFNVSLPYEPAVSFIDKILHWHVPKNVPSYEQFRGELIRKCWTFLNDLQYKEIFYIYPPEMIAISAITLTFSLLDIPLISPKVSPWFTFLVPSINIQKSYELTCQIHEFFRSVFENKKFTDVSSQNMIDLSLFVEWINFPLIPLEKQPICEPPSFELLDSLVKDNDSFKKSEADHCPQFPPPLPNQTELPSNLVQFQNECKMIPK